MEPTIRHELDDHVATVWLHRPHRHNAWTGRMHAEFRTVMDTLERDPEVRVVIVTGTPPAFCVGLVLFSLGFGETRGTFGNYVPDPRYYPPMEQALNNGNVAVYSINTLGATRGGNTITGITDSLNSISRDTGGYYYSNFINVKTPLNQVAEDNKGYYLLSYRSEHDLGEEGYQEVTVETNVAAAKVRARQGYRFGDVPQAAPPSE